VHIWQQRSFLFGFHTDARRNKARQNKLKVIKDAILPTDIKTIRFFLSMSNFFKIHIKDFAMISVPHFEAHSEGFRL
jgi:hypothetical protein